VANRLTKGRALFGAIRSARGGLGSFLIVNTIARTDTSAKVLGVLPKDAQITRVSVWGAAVSNAATTATVSVGKSGGTGAEYLSAFDVKGATGAGQQTPAAALLMAPTAAASDTTVTGTYAETGTASTAGGPWTCLIEFVL
jgi:hypothetical protein